MAEHLFAAAAIAVAFVLPAHAEPVADMPYIKAYAYALSIEKYCFGGPVDKRLEDAALKQTSVAFDDFPADFKPYDIADAHLKGDQSACPAAAAFVERIIATLPNAELDRLATETGFF